MSWDLTWHDGGKDRKRQYCPGCKSYSEWLHFDSIEGQYANKVFPGSLPDVYWTPWPLPSETPILFYLKSNERSGGKRTAGATDKGKQVAKKTKVA